MEMAVMKDRGNYTDWEKINMVRQFIKHLVWDDDAYEYYYDDLVLPKVNKMKVEYKERKQDEAKCKSRRDEINKELENELLTDNERSQLVNEYNECGLKWFANCDDELYEALINLPTIYEIYQWSEFSLPNAIFYYVKYNIFNRVGGEKTIYDMNKPMYYNCEETNWRLHCINNIINFLKLVMKKYNISRKSLLIIMNGIILDEYDNYMQGLGDDFWSFFQNPVEAKKLLEPYGPFCNIVDMFITYLEGIDIDRFIQYYPIKKDYTGIKFGWKDYYSTIESIQHIKEDAKNFTNNKLNKQGARFLIFENGLQFSEPIIGNLALMLFDTIGYGTNIDTGELLFEFLDELQKESNKPNLHLIK